MIDTNLGKRKTDQAENAPFFMHINLKITGKPIENGLSGGL